MIGPLCLRDGRRDLRGASILAAAAFIARQQGGDRSGHDAQTFSGRRMHAVAVATPIQARDIGGDEFSFRMSALLGLADLLLGCGSCARAHSPASVNASKLVFPVFAHRMMLWATRLRRLCAPPFGQRSQAFSSAPSIAAIVGRSKRSTIIVESPPPGTARLTSRSVKMNFYEE